jgi:hypothetical protein
MPVQISSEIVAAVLAFLFGLVSKLLFDSWTESRQKQSLLFSKKVKASFSTSSLSKEIRENASLIYNGQEVTQLLIVTIDVENNGRSRVRNQAFTIVCDSKDARIINDPKYSGSPEDLEFVQEDESKQTANTRRFIIRLLQRKHRLSWEFVVVSCNVGDIKIYPGLASEEAQTDFDVNSPVVSSKMQVDLEGRLANITLYLTMTGALILLSEPVKSLGGSPFSLAINIIAICFLGIFAYEIRKIIPLIMEFVRSLDFRKAESWIEAESINTGGGNFIGHDQFYPKSASKIGMVINTQFINIVQQKINSLEYLQEEEKISVYGLLENLKFELSQGNEDESILPILLRIAKCSPKSLQLIIEALPALDQPTIAIPIPPLKEEEPN